MIKEILKNTVKVGSEIDEIFKIVFKRDIENLDEDSPIQIPDDLYIYKDNSYRYLPKFFTESGFYQKYKYDISVISKPKLIKYKNQFDESLECRYTPTEEQQEVLDKLEYIYNTKGSVNGILKLRTGFGKTFISLYFANKYKLKTIIFVDNEMLFNQWIDKIKEYFPNLKTAFIGRISGKEMFLPEGARFTVAYVQSINSKIRKGDKTTIQKLINQKYGLVIFDEVHKVSASVRYSKISSLFDTANVIGLSATPYKYGFQRLMLESSVGKIIAEKTDYDYIPNVAFVEYDSMLNYYIDGKQVKKLVFLTNVNKVNASSVYSSYITQSPKFFEIIKKIVSSMRKKGHKIIIITKTIKQADVISSIIPGSVAYHSKNKNVNLEEADIIVGTYKMLSHGFDKKDLTCVIFASPFTGKTSIPQVIGRILRKHEIKEVLKPAVIFLIDKRFKKLFNIGNITKVIKNEYKTNIKVFDENGKFLYTL